LYLRLEPGLLGGLLRIRQAGELSGRERNNDFLDFITKWSNRSGNNEVARDGTGKFNVIIDKEPTADRVSHTVASALGEELDGVR
jgi:hypothetical protein